MYMVENALDPTVFPSTLRMENELVAMAAAHLAGDGDAGYLEFARQVLGATRRIAEHVDASPDLRLLGRPEMNLVAFTSDTVSVFHVIDEMKMRGWYIQPQLGYGDSKENIQLSINPASVRWVDALLADLDECVATARSMESGDLTAKIRAAFGELDPRTLGDDAFQGLLAMAGVQGSALPGRMADVNEVLNALPVEMRERLLVEYLNELFRQPE